MVLVNNASPHVLWEVLRRNSAFIKRQRGINKHFSTEKYNVAKVNSPRFNGLINRRGVDVQASKDGKELIVTLKTKQAAVHPIQSERQTTVRTLKGARANIKSVKAIVAGYKPAHSRVAAKRASQLLRTAKPVKAKGGAKRVKSE